MYHTSQLEIYKQFNQLNEHIIGFKTYATYVYAKGHCIRQKRVGRRDESTRCYLNRFLVLSKQKRGKRWQICINDAA